MAVSKQPNLSQNPQNQKLNYQEGAYAAPYSTDVEAERPLSPGLVTRVTEIAGKKALDKNEDEEGNDANANRVVRRTEMNRVNSTPSSAYPG